MTRVNAAVIYLTQNTPERRVYLKTSLYFLFRHFNDRHRYPVVIFHEGDYDDDAMAEVTLGIRRTCRHLVSFRRTAPGDFQLPAGIDGSTLERAVAARPVPWWRTARYRMMCRWWLASFPSHVADFDYVMRLDDDAFLEEDVRDDLFADVRRARLDYLSCQLHLECAICSLGMKRFFLERFPRRRSRIERQFVPLDGAPTAKEQDGLQRLAAALPDDDGLRADIAGPRSAPLMFYNNFHITKPAFWLRDDVRETLHAIDASGAVFYRRWGDAPLQTLIVTAHARPSAVGLYPLRYSKRAQREAFRDDDGCLHDHVPAMYAQTGDLLRDQTREPPR